MGRGRPASNREKKTTTRKKPLMVCRKSFQQSGMPNHFLNGLTKALTSAGYKGRIYVYQKNDSCGSGPFYHDPECVWTINWNKWPGWTSSHPRFSVRFRLDLTEQVKQGMKQIINDYYSLCLGSIRWPWVEGWHVTFPADGVTDMYEKTSY